MSRSNGTVARLHLFVPHGVFGLCVVRKVSSLPVGSEPVKYEAGGAWCCPAEDCTYSNRDKSIVRHHIVKHTGERAFKCVCGKAYGLKSHLTVHVRKAGGDHREDKKSVLGEKREEIAAEPPSAVPLKRVRAV